MNEILAVTSAICASALICTLVSNFVTDGSTKKIICLVLGAFGIANMWAAIFADVGVMIIAVLNAVRALFVDKL